MKSKLLIASSLILVASGVTVYFVADANEPEKIVTMEALQPEDVNERPVVEPTGEPAVVETVPPGEGLVGEENPDIEVSEDFYIEILLPFVNDASLPQGSGFVLKGSDLPADTELVATAVTRPETDTAPIEVGSVTTDASGELDATLPMPTNISKGSYTMVLTGADEEITFDFTVIGAGEVH